jgi:hypothetical protein
MNTLKLGSKGNDVKTLQQCLNITVDGSFGIKTEQAVKLFQQKNNLKVDGIVGDSTWKALGIKSISKCIDSSVKYKPLSTHITPLSNRSIKYLIIHYTAGSSSIAGKALALYNVFSIVSASADFAVDDTDIVQFNPDIKNYYCWAVGDSKKTTKGGGKYYGKATNKNSISIEICSTCNPSTSKAVSTANHSGWSFTETSLSNAAKVAKIIMKTYNIPLSNVIRHYDVTGKLCPGIIGWNDEQIYDSKGKLIIDKMSSSDNWLEFKKRLV